MRLTPNKIDYLATKLLQMFQESGNIHPTTNSDLVIRAIEDVIFENMRDEEAIDAEAEELPQQHRGEIQTLEMDMGALRSRFKRELAKKHGFVL